MKLNNIKTFPFLAAALLLGFSTSLTAQKPKGSGPGKTQFGVDASEWSSLTPGEDGVLPVGGSGQVNGNFVTAERNGIQIGMRAVERFSPDPLDLERDVQTGVYYASTGVSDGINNAMWNFDIHVDLRDATGVAKGKTLDDYDLVLETDYVTELTFGAAVVPIEDFFHIFADFSNGEDPEIVLYQESWNPGFGNTTFDPEEPGTYSFRLILTPTSFNGPSLAVDVEVVVEEVVEE